MNFGVDRATLSMDFGKWEVLGDLAWNDVQGNLLHQALIQCIDARGIYLVAKKRVMDFYFPDSQDQISPHFNFESEEHPPYRIDQQDDWLCVGFGRTRVYRYPSIACDGG